jgi:hypothetical protein
MGIVLLDSGILCLGEVELMKSSDVMKDALRVKATDVKEMLLYGLAKGSTERWQEELLLSNATPEKIEKVKVLAKRDGYHSFRVGYVDLGAPPDFGSTVNVKSKKGKR